MAAAPAAKVASAMPREERRRSTSPRHQYQAAVAPSKIARIAHVLGCDSSAAVASPPTRTIAAVGRSGSDAASAASVATNSVWPNALVRFPHVMIHAVI